MMRIYEPAAAAFEWGGTAKNPIQACVNSKIGGHTIYPGMEVLTFTRGSGTVEINCGIYMGLIRTRRLNCYEERYVIRRESKTPGKPGTSKYSYSIMHYANILRTDTFKDFSPHLIVDMFDGQRF